MPLDRICLRGLTFFGRHGVYPAERELGQRFRVDLELEGDLSAARHSDRLEDTLDYGKACALVRGVVEGEPCNLLETVAERILGSVLELPHVERATVRVHKRAPLEMELEDVYVEITGARS
ncbi:MAG TPA: dihydroneopterin aldolase [Candidatus Dormibacteraeota bacterium]|nr:dihydroneopterin aldolase [Candidatus Dormibacteraeota bacterium]